MSKIVESKVVTDHGLNLPEDITEDQFFEVGKRLADFERGYQWALGDWYNSIPWGDKKAACEKAGLNFKTAQRCAEVCRFFQMPGRSGILSFNHYQKLTISDLTIAQAESLIKKAVEGGWSANRLVEERDKLLGHWEEPVAVTEPDAIGDFVEKSVDKVPERYKRQMVKAANALGAQLAHDFESQVRVEVDARVKEQRKRLDGREKQAQAEFDNAVKLKRGVMAFMTEKEFRLVRSCLHPDKHNNDPKYAKAFDIFNRLAETTDLKIAG